jgi:crotonobetainyl-CoA:carnitine CoA-transferase CaiB-like acyl-CoA transferase
MIELRVVEATEGIAGAYATKLLADLGAQVTKIERASGDPLRWWSAASPDEPLTTTGALFTFLNEAKTVVTAEDARETEALVRAADVVVAGNETDLILGDGVLEHARGSQTSVVRVSAFGSDGPLAGVVADEFSLQAWCGLMSGCGTRETTPLPMGIRHGQWATGAMTALAALAACAHRAGTSQPADVEVAALEVMAVCLMNYPALYRHFTGSVAVMSRGGDWPQVVRCKDGWIGLCIFTPQQWDDFANMIGRPDLVGDARLNSMGGRGRNRELAHEVIRPWLAEHTATEIFELGGLFRVPVAYVGNGRDVLDMEHFEARGVFVTNASGVAQPRSPFLLHDSGAVDHEPVMRPPTGPSARPLEGVRVLDFTAFWAGPAATHLLATLGADVVKIESPTRPDGMRFATTRPPDDAQWVEYSPTFHGTNPGKRSVAIDFSTPEGRELVLQLVEHADVVVENFTPRVMPNVGLDYEALAARKPELVMLRMPAFGLDGPWRDHSGFAQTTEQVSGIAWLTGTPDVDPIVRSTVDPIAGIHGAVAVLAALERRRRTGAGALIELPMVEVALNVAAEPIVTWSAYGMLLERQGARGPHGAPQGVYACSGDEQWVALSIGDDDQWRALRKVMADPVWARDARFETSSLERRRDHDEIDEHLRAWFAEQERDAIVAVLLAAGVHAAPVWDQNRLDELPHLAARGFTQWLDHPVAGPVPYPGTGMRSPQFDLTYRAPAPTVGQHTHEVLHELLGADGA